MVVALLQTAQVVRVRGEDHADYKYEDYGEENGRIRVQTHSALFEKSIGESVTAKGEFVYDSISGATPTGAPPPDGSNQVPLAHMDDIRRAGNVAFDIKYGIHTTTPMVAYSVESDYESIGISLTHAMAFNEKNTVVTLGVAHDFDTIQPTYWAKSESKDNTDVLVGLTQLLGPKTLLSANFVFGAASGYMADPYRGFRFDGYPDPDALFPESRPDEKTKQVFLVSVDQHVDPLRGSLEASYRFYHDSFGIFSHTGTLEWFQRFGKHVVVAPMARYYYQTEADFYATRLPGDPSIPPDDPFFSGVYTPEYYSSDYRLSEMQTLTYGVSLTVMVGGTVYLDAAYHRYDMQGLDSVTSSSAYPDANVYTAGLRLWF